MGKRRKALKELAFAARLKNLFRYKQDVFVTIKVKAMIDSPSQILSLSLSLNFSRALYSLSVSFFSAFPFNGLFALVSFRYDSNLYTKHTHTYTERKRVKLQKSSSRRRRSSRSLAVFFVFSLEMRER